MKNNKRITFLLLALLTGIWGSIIYQIIDVVDSESDDSTDVALPVNEKKHDSVFTYRDDVRDPFRLVPERPKREQKTASVEMWVPPPFRLTGIVAAGKKRIAVLEGLDGTTYFLSEGESLNGVKMMKVHDRAVTYRYMNQTKEWALR